MFSFSSGCYSVSYQDILKHGLWDDSTKSNSSKLFVFLKIMAVTLWMLLFIVYKLIASCLFSRMYFNFQINVWTTYKEHVSLLVKFTSPL